MIRSVIFEAPAQAEIAAAFEWYEQRSYGLGGEFLRSVAAAEERLARTADQYPEARVAFDASCYVASRTPCTLKFGTHSRSRFWPVCTTAKVLAAGPTGDVFG